MSVPQSHQLIRVGSDGKVLPNGENVRNKTKKTVARVSAITTCLHPPEKYKMERKKAISGTQKEQTNRTEGAGGGLRARRPELLAKESHRSHTHTKSRKIKGKTIDVESAECWSSEPGK